MSGTRKSGAKSGAKSGGKAGAKKTAGGRGSRILVVGLSPVESYLIIAGIHLHQHLAWLYILIILNRQFCDVP